MRILPLILILAAFPFVTGASDSRQKPIPAAVITTTVNRVAEVLNEAYVYPEIAAEMQAFLNQQMLAGKYRNSQSQRELITRLQSDLRDVSGDGHIGLLLAEDSVDRTSHVRKKAKSQERVHAEIISETSKGRRIGYLKFNKFSADAETTDRLVNAMDHLAESDSLIIDLRENEGGDPNLVELLSSYFLKDDTPLWSLIDRNGDQVFEARSNDNQNKYTGDLCVLTSYKTYSAAEAFAYTLKHLGRASVIGEATGGGAHLVEMRRVNEMIDIRIPVVRAYNHVTESNWEGGGVIPTLEVKASEAKLAAIKFLNDKLEK